MKKVNYFIEKILTFINVTIFGLGSFLCFIVALIEMQERLLISGLFLLLLTFANQKIIYYIFKNND